MQDTSLVHLFLTKTPPFCIPQKFIADTKIADTNIGEKCAPRYNGGGHIFLALSLTFNKLRFRGLANILTMEDDRAICIQVGKNLIARDKGA